MKENIKTKRLESSKGALKTFQIEKGVKEESHQHNKILNSTLLP